MEIRFNQPTSIQNINKPPFVTFEIIDPNLEESEAHIRLNFNTSIPLGTTLELLGTTFIAGTETKLPYYFSASSPAISIHNLINYHPQYNDFSTLVESTHILQIYAKLESKHILLVTESIGESEAIESVTIVDTGTTINPYFLPQNRLIINYQVGQKYSENNTWLNEKRVRAQKVYSLSPSGIHPISLDIPTNKVEFARVPQTGLQKLPFASIQLTAFLQEENGNLTRLSVSNPLLFLPNIPTETDANTILPSPSQIGAPLNNNESKVLIEGSPALPLYFIIPEQNDRYIDNTASINLIINTLERDTILSTETVRIGNANTPGLYAYWLQASDFSNPQLRIKVSVEAGTQVLYQSADWEFSLQQNTSETITLGFLNPFGLPSFLHIPVANEHYQNGKQRYLSEPLALELNVLKQWEQSLEKWMVLNDNETGNTISAISYLTSTDNLLTLTLETHGK